MVITLTLKIYEHEKCNIDTPLAQLFMCFIWQNILIILFILKCWVLNLYSLFTVFCLLLLLSHLAFVSLEQRVYSI